MQDDHLSLIIRKNEQRTPEVQFRRIIPLRRSEPRRFVLEGNTTLANLDLVEDGIVHAPEQIRLDIYNLELGSVSEQFQENLMHRILSSAAISRDCDCEEQERRAMVPVYAFDLEGVFVWQSHAAVSMVRQSYASHLSISARKLGGQVCGKLKGNMRHASLIVEFAISCGLEHSSRTVNPLMFWRWGVGLFPDVAGSNTERSSERDPTLKRCTCTI
jgi:hypothetical protein